MILDQNENKMICEELSKVGLHINSIYDLVNSDETYPEAMPILINMLPVVKSDRIKEGVARALTIKNAGKEVAQALIKEFASYQTSTETEELVKWAIANAISEVAGKTQFDEVLKLIYDKSNGKSRGPLVNLISKKNSPHALEILIELLKDEDISINAMLSLGRIKSEKALPHLQEFLSHDDKWLRKEAERTIKKINKKLGR